MKKNVRIMVVCTVLVVVIVYTCKSILLDKDKMIVGTNTEPIRNNLNYLDNIEASYWEAIVYKGFIGPTAYKLYGYYVSKDSLEYKYADKFNFLLIDDNIISLSNPPIKLENNNWYHSVEFDEFMLQVGSFGKLYLCFDENIVYFEIYE